MVLSDPPTRRTSSVLLTPGLISGRHGLAAMQGRPDALWLGPEHVCGNFVIGVDRFGRIKYFSALYRHLCRVM